MSLHDAFEACCGSLVARANGQLYVYVSTIACWMPDSGPDYPLLHTLLMTEFLEHVKESTSNNNNKRQTKKAKESMVDAVLHHTTPTVLALATHLLQQADIHRLGKIDVLSANAPRLVPLQQNLVLDADTCGIYCRLPEHGFLFSYNVHWHKNSLPEERKCAQWFVSSFGVAARHMALCMQRSFSIQDDIQETIVLEGSAAARRRLLDVLALLLGTRLQKHDDVVLQRRVVYSEPHDRVPSSHYYLQHWQFLALSNRRALADRIVLLDQPAPEFTVDDISVVFSYLMAFV